MSPIEISTDIDILKCISCRSRRLILHREVKAARVFFFYV